jgi:hypothetical protein
MDWVSCRILFDYFVDPISDCGDSRVDSRVVWNCAAEAPRDNSDQFIGVGHERAAGVT